MRFRDFILEQKMSTREAMTVFGIDQKDLGNNIVIKKRYRELSSKHHPDHGGDLEMMKKINAAYDVLKKTKAVSSIGGVDWEKIARENREIGAAIKTQLLTKFDPELYIKYFERFTNEKFEFEMKRIFPDEKMRSPDHAGFNCLFFTKGRDTAFELDVSANIIDIKRGENTLGSGDFDFKLFVIAYGFHNNKKQKLSQSNYKFTNDHSMFRDPSKIFPEAKMKKIFSGETSKRAFKKRDMLEFIKTKLKGDHQGNDFSKIPLGNDYYLLIYRHVIMRVAGWGINGLYKKHNKINQLTYASFIESEDTAKFFEDLQKGAMKIKDEDRLIKYLVSAIDKKKKEKK